MAAIQALKKAKSLAPASGILPPKAAEGIIKTNASPHGLTFCHKVIRTVPEISGYGITSKTWTAVAGKLNLFIPEAYTLVDAAVDDIVEIESAAACHIRGCHEYHDMTVGKILYFGGFDVKLA